MKNQLQLSITLPFAYYVNRDSATGVPLLRFPSPRMIQQYVDALCAEMTLWKDCEEMEIGAIRFEGGYIHMMKPEMLKQLIDQIQAVFPLSADCEWIALTCPGGYLAPLVSLIAARRFKIMLDIPTFLKTEADDNLLPFGPAFEEGKLTDYPAAGIRTLQEIIGRTPEAQEKTQERLTALRPARVELISLSGQSEETQGSRGLREFLEKSGYRRICMNEYALPDGEFRHQHDLSSLSQYVGLGLGACSIYDGYLSQNTNDFKKYVAAAGNPALLYEEVKELTDASNKA